MHCDVIGRVALDFVLWIVRAGVNRVPLELDLGGYHSDDLSRDAASFRVPAHVITALESPHRHDFPVRHSLVVP